MRGSDLIYGTVAFAIVLPPAIDEIEPRALPSRREAQIGPGSARCITENCEGRGLPKRQLIAQHPAKQLRHQLCEEHTHHSCLGAIPGYSGV